jgi:nondiscriminating aspartyl-tRNA synthetase
MISTETTSTATSPPPVRTLAADLPARAGERVTVEGWLHRRRTLKSVTFLILRDRTGLTQVVCTTPEQLAAVEGAGEETVCRVSGIATPNEQAPGGVELTEPSVTVLSSLAAPAPFDLYRPSVPATLPTILDHAPVALRHPRLRAPHVIAAASVAGYRAALDGLGFTEIHTPKIVGSATESGANVFEIDYFGSARTWPSPRSSSSRCMVGVFERVYETGAGLPGRAARHGAAPGAVHQRWTPSSASSRTITT